MADIIHAIPHVDYSFQSVGINWLPDNNKAQVYIRDFQQALFSLLTNQNIVREENFLFPQDDTPFLSPNF